MRKMLLIALCFSHLYLTAQDYRDVVYLKNGSVIKGFYKELYTNDTLRMETLDGSLIVCPMSDVVRIAKERTNVYVINKEDKSFLLDRKWRPRGYSGSFQIVNSMHKEGEYASCGSSALYTVHGYRFNPNLFLGGGIGYEKYTVELLGLNIVQDTPSIPVFAETRIYATRTRIAPVILCRGGYSLKTLPGWFVSPGIGIDYCFSPRSAVYVHAMYRLQWCHFNHSISSSIIRYDFWHFAAGIRF